MGCPSHRPRYWLTRLYIALSVLSNCLVAYLEPGSLTHQVLRNSPTGWTMIGLLCALSIVALLDVVVNDLMPDRYTLPAAKEHRHWVYVGIALALLGLFYAIVREEGWTPLLFAYGVDLVAALAVAPLDLFARHRRHA